MDKIGMTPNPSATLKSLLAGLAAMDGRMLVQPHLVQAQRRVGAATETNHG